MPPDGDITIARSTPEIRRFSTVPLLTFIGLCLLYMHLLGICFSWAIRAALRAVRTSCYPMGRRFPEADVMFELQRTPIRDALATEQRDVTAKDVAGDTEPDRRFADLHFDSHARQEPPVRLDERAARRQIDYMRRAARSQACPLHSFHRERWYPRRCAPFVVHRVSHAPVPKLNSRMRVRPVAPRIRTANWFPLSP